MVHSGSLLAEKNAKGHNLAMRPQNALTNTKHATSTTL
jgi:hypothetical protein